VVAVPVSARLGDSTRAFTIDELKTIAETYLYGFPMIAGSRALYEFNMDSSSGQFKGPSTRSRTKCTCSYPRTPRSARPAAKTLLNELDLGAELMVLTVNQLEEDNSS